MGWTNLASIKFTIFNTTTKRKCKVIKFYHNISNQFPSSSYNYQNQYIIIIIINHKRRWAEQNLAGARSRSSTPNKRSSSKKLLLKVQSSESEEESPRESYRRNRSSNTSERTKELDRELKRLQIEQQRKKLVRGSSSSPVRVQLVLAGDGLHPASLIVRFFANILNIFVTQALVFGLAFCFYLLIDLSPHYNRW